MKLLKKFHDLMPKITIGLLLAEPISDNTVALARSVGATYVHPDVNGLTEAAVQLLLANQLGVNVWTVNDAETAQRLADWGAHAIFTDFPKTM